MPQIHGGLMASTKPVERFEGNYEPITETGCWIWLGTVNDKGYGRFRSKILGPGKHYAHRVSYVKFKGPIPDGLDVLHQCDNPLCVNPAHLRVGTQAENNKERDMRGRHRALRGSDNGNSKLDAEKIKTIFESQLSAVKLSPILGVHWSTISRVRAGKTWSKFLGL